MTEITRESSDTSNCNASSSMFVSYRALPRFKIDETSLQSRHHRSARIPRCQVRRGGWAHDHGCCLCVLASPAQCSAPVMFRVFVPLVRQLAAELLGCGRWGGGETGVRAGICCLIGLM